MNFSYFARLSSFTLSKGQQMIHVKIALKVSFLENREWENIGKGIFYALHKMNDIFPNL